MITAVSKWMTSTFATRTYAAMMPPEMWAMPAVMMVMSSDMVMVGRNGRMVSGASVCPMKIEAATEVDSAPDAPMKRDISLAKKRTTTCITPM